MRYETLKRIAIFLTILVIIGILCVGFVYVTTNHELAYNNSIQTNTVAINESSNNIENVEKVSVSKNIINLKEYLESLNQIPDYGIYFELPIEGATGYASINSNIRKNPSDSAEILLKINAGTAFEIVEESGNWFKININNKVGWISNKYCMVNLPDIIPSIIYDDTNSYSSLFKSSEIDIPNITGKQLYNNKAYNKRLSKDEYMMPVIYAMAKKIMIAQKTALEDGYSLKIYETYRPFEAQKAVADNLRNLMNTNKTVYSGINGGGWNEGWFIAQVLSNHQRGIAMDVSLVKINDYEIKKTGSYKYMAITDYTEEEMPTQMHELSNKAISLKYAVDSNSKTAWKDVPLANAMTNGAIRLRDYCVQAGLSPLCSEWWHFNDLDAREDIGNNYSTGRYYITKCCSSVPE